MAGHSDWSAQALQHLDNSDGPLKVKYFQSSREVLEEVQDNPIVFRNIGHPRFYTDNSNARQSSVHFKAKPRPEFKKEKLDEEPWQEKKDEEFLGYPKWTLARETPEEMQKSGKTQEEMQRSGKTPKVMQRSGEKIIPYSFGLPQGHHEGLQRRIDSIERFLSRVFPLWYSDPDFNLKKVIQDMIPSKPRGTRKPTVTNPDPHADGYPREWGYKYALVFGETTEFNPSGIWIVEEFYNNDDM